MKVTHGNMHIQTATAVEGIYYCTYI